MLSHHPPSPTKTIGFLSAAERELSPQSSTCCSSHPLRSTPAFTEEVGSNILGQYYYFRFPTALGKTKRGALRLLSLDVNSVLHFSSQMLLTRDEVVGNYKGRTFFAKERETEGHYFVSTFWAKNAFNGVCFGRSEN